MPTQYQSHLPQLRHSITLLRVEKHVRGLHFTEAEVLGLADLQLLNVAIVEVVPNHGVLFKVAGVADVVA